MKILIVDDKKTSQALLQSFLNKSGFDDLIITSSAQEAYKILGINTPGQAIVEVDLILIDNFMPDINGLEATRRIKEEGPFKDVPLIMITSSDDVDDLQRAFDAGAIDFIKKPFNIVELATRVKSALKLKQEMDGRKKAIKKLELLASVDGLTGIANRRYFDDFLSREWRRTLRYNIPLSLILADIDYFKKYNDGYGHQAGDECLKQIAKILTSMAQRPGDLAARYGGEEFAIVLGNTELKGATDLTEKIRSGVEKMKIPHEYSEGGSLVTISLGVAGFLPEKTKTTAELIKIADKALYKAKEEGRNKVVVSDF